MARRNAEQDIDVDETDLIDDVDIEDEGEDVVDAPEAKEKVKKEKAPARGDLPEGYVTPVELAKVLTERKMHTNRQGEVAEVKPQMVYSYIRNAPKDNAFPIETVTDSNGKERQAVKLEAGIEWWAAKNERTAARKANAANKEAKKAERAAAKAAEAEAEGDEVEGVEVEGSDDVE